MLVIDDFREDASNKATLKETPRPVFRMPSHSGHVVVEFPGRRQQFSSGDRVRIRAVREIGSARLLHGFTGEVVGPHPIARNWYKVRLDPNENGAQTDWPVPADRLIREADTNDVTLPPAA